MKRPDPIPLPGHAYVPGQTPRHAEGAFDDLRRTVRAGMSLAEMEDCPAWVAGWQFMDAGYFWEAHEVLEPVWMALPEWSVERRFVQAAIQAANAGLKARMDRPAAVRRLAGIVEDLLREVPPDAVILGRSADCVHAVVSAAEKR